MNLTQLVLLLMITALGFQFWRIRKFSETAAQYLVGYCRTHNLQLLSVARQSTRLTTRAGRFDWHSRFEFEFSGNGEDRYTGTLEMVGGRVLRTDIPPHRIN